MRTKYITRFVALVACLALMIISAPTMVLANPADDELSINGTVVMTAGNFDQNALNSFPGLSFDRTTNTLTMTDFSGESILAENFDLTITLAGTNTLSGTVTSGTGLLGTTFGFLTIQGSGTLNITGNPPAGNLTHLVYSGTDTSAPKGIVIDGATVNVTLNQLTPATPEEYLFAVSATAGTLTVRNGATLTSYVNAAASATNAAAIQFDGDTMDWSRLLYDSNLELSEGESPSTASAITATPTVRSTATYPSSSMPNNLVLQRYIRIGAPLNAPTLVPNNPTVDAPNNNTTTNTKPNPKTGVAVI